MKAKLIAVSLVLAARAFASTTNVDLGPDGTYYHKVYGFDGLTGTVMQGQSVTFDLIFNTSVHLFSNTHRDFNVGLSFLASTSNPGFIGGTGYILDSAGQQMCDFRPIAAANSELGELFIGFDPLNTNLGGFPATDITRPLDFYGAHFELTMPDNGLTITAGLMELYVSDYTYSGNDPHGFRIGPHVPDAGATSLMFAMACLLLLLGRIRYSR